MKIKKQKIIFEDDSEQEIDLATELSEETPEKDITILLNTDITKKQFPVEVKDLGEGVLEAIVASDTLDRHGEIVDIKGLDIKKYMQNPVVAWGHDYSEPAIAKTEKLTKTKDGKLVARMKFATDIYEKAKIVYNLYKDGFMKAFSIGFIPQEMEGNKYTKSEMIEFSAVLVPANPEALLLARSKGIDTDILLNYNNKQMYKLEEILKKEIDDLTVGEVKFLQENIDDLTKNQIKKYASVLKTDTEDPKKEEKKDEAKSEDKKDNTEVVLNTLAESVNKLATSVEELKTNEPVAMKNINTHQNKNVNINQNKQYTKEQKFLYFARGLQTGDFNEYISAVGEDSARGKDAMNTSDDSVVVPPFEFITEIERLEEEFGVARRFANVRQSTSGAGIKYLMGDDDVEIFDTAESGVKKSTKLSYQQLLLAWRKFASILPITDELSEDAAIDLWNDATRRYARAFAKREDQLVFTETAAGGNTKNGITKVSGTNVVTIGGDSILDVTYDDLIDMIFGVPSTSANGARWYFNRGMLGVLSKIKDESNRPIWADGIQGGPPATLLGYPYTETEVLPNVDADGASKAFAVFGDLRYATLAERTALNIKIFDSGSVGDPDDADQSDQINLLTQDVQAMRAVKRMNAVVRFPEAFSVLKTAAS